MPFDAKWAAKSRSPSSSHAHPSDSTAFLRPDLRSASGARSVPARFWPSQKGAPTKTSLRCCNRHGGFSPPCEWPPRRSSVVPPPPRRPNAECTPLSAERPPRGPQDWRRGDRRASWLVEGARSTSPKMAASSMAVSATGAAGTRDGWTISWPTAFRAQ
eukprot:scaffold64794_cov66-Phaeocystis_antarctica.AAC.2